MMNNIYFLKITDFCPKKSLELTKLYIKKNPDRLDSAQKLFRSAISSAWEIQPELITTIYTVRNYLHGLQNSGESMGDSDLHADFGPVTW